MTNKIKNIDSLVRLCGACLEPSAILAVSYTRDELLWLCWNCAHVELSDLTGTMQLREPTSSELRRMMDTDTAMGRLLCEKRKQVLTRQ